MSKISLVTLAVCMSVLTGCSTVHVPTGYSKPTSHSSTSYSQTSKNAEFSRAYASLSDENRRLINKHISESYITTKKESSAHGSVAVKDILEYAQYLEQIEIANRREKETKAQAERNRQKKIQTDLAKKVDCNLFEWTDFIPGIGWLRGITKPAKWKKIIEAQQRGLCKTWIM